MDECIYEFYFDLSYFKVVGFYILDVITETPKTFRGNVLSHRGGKSFDRFILQKDKLNRVSCGLYGGRRQLKTYVVSTSDDEALRQAKRLFAGFLSKVVSELNEE